MKPPRSFPIRLAALSACPVAILVAHQLLARQLAAILLAADATAAIASATLIASLVVHCAVGVWVLPLARRLASIGIPVAASGIAIGGALVTMIVRALAEAGLGALLGGLPVVMLATTLGALALVLTDEPGRARSRRRIAVRGARVVAMRRAAAEVGARSAPASRAG